MIIVINKKDTKFCQITLHIEIFIQKRKAVFPASWCTQGKVTSQYDTIVILWAYHGVMC